MRSHKSNLHFLSDLAKAAAGAIGPLSELREQVKNQVKERVDGILSELDLVSREEFDRVEAIAKKARERQEQLERRLSALEKQLKKKGRK